MPNGDDQHKRRARLSRHPYPLLRVPLTDTFLDALEKALSAATSWRFDTNHADHRAVVAIYTGDAFAGEGLGVSAYDRQFDRVEPSNVISFATLAHRWYRDGKEVIFVSDGDIAAAFKLFLPIVRIACQACGTRCRVIYPKPDKVKPLAPGPAEQLTSFVRFANPEILHPFDWERFYQFVRYCHAHHVSLSQGRLRTELALRGVQPELAEELSLCYAHGRSILSGRFEWVD